MGVEMISELKETGVRIKSLTMDNDSTTIAHVRALHGDIRKLSDKNHTKKHHQCTPRYESDTQGNEQP